MTGCTTPLTPAGQTHPQLTPAPRVTFTLPPLAATATPLPVPTLPPAERVLTVCTAQEPASLFLYGARSASAANILSAIYDGPVDVRNAQDTPVLLARLPTLASGEVTTETVRVEPGDSIVDWDGNLTYLAEGASYLPAGCRTPDCARTYSGNQPVEMEQFVVTFTLRPGIVWSDGIPLTADDSVYSYEVAKSLPANARPSEVALTHTYRASTELTVEWRGIPGFRNIRYADFFFSPLPRHAWGALSVEALWSSEISARLPMGWGPYVLEQWTAGDHISLRKNSRYFRAAEGLPHFDHLVFRFVASEVEGLSALLAGECDLADQTVWLGAQTPRLLELQAEGRLTLFALSGSAWEAVVFGIESLDTHKPAWFAARETRRAVAQCIDREAIAARMPLGQRGVFDTYTLPFAPWANAELSPTAFAPQSAAEALTALGWIDDDGKADTPRIAHGVAGVPEGSPFEVVYLVSLDADSQAAAQVVKSSLAQCGIRVQIVSQPPDEFLAAGPEGAVFGRQFDMAQFAWPATYQPACFLFQSSEIPGPYPDYPKGWGGANAMAYRNPEFDRLCQMTRLAPLDSPDYRQASDQAQAVFAEDVPLVPLFVRFALVAARPDFCGLTTESALDDVFWNLESFDYGPLCTPTVH